MSRSTLLRGLLAATIAMALAGAATAADWPQWRGVDRNGRSAETGPWLMLSCILS